jgi:hypothetical protein
MNYGIIVIVLAIVDILTIYSGLPTGWKKALVVIVSLVLLAAGWMLHVIAKKRALRVHRAVAEIETRDAPIMNDVADEVAFDVAHQIEEEIDQIVESTNHEHHYEVTEE